jgi:hypothetical protein
MRKPHGDRPHEALMSKRIRLSRRHDYRPIPQGREHPGLLHGDDPSPSERNRGVATAERLAALDPLGDAAEDAD